MRALTLHQPWASLVAMGHKRFETRGWSTKYRGPLLIHAGKFINHHVLQAVRVQTDWLEQAKIHVGSVIAVAELTEVLPTVGMQVIVSDKEERLGNFDPERWAWRLEDVRALSEPVECRGYQGLWTPPEEVVEMVMAQVREVCGEASTVRS